MAVYIKKGKSNNKTKESRYRKEKVCAETAAHDNIYKQRRCIVEHPFGTIKRQLGYTFFLRRGIENVDAECASMFIAYNLKRLFGMLSVTELKKKFETCRA